MKADLLLIASLTALIAQPATGQVIEISPHRQEHTRDATVVYQTTKIEEKLFTEKKPDAGKPTGFGTKEPDSLKGKKGSFIAWFGIVREIKKAEGGGVEMLIEHKYYDGLNDFHMQLASLFGAGDFKVTVQKPHEELKRLCLISVIGKVVDEKDGVPIIASDYIRVWRKGDYAFMDYGVDASNEKWVKLRKRTPREAYDPSPDDAYYKEILGE